MKDNLQNTSTNSACMSATKEYECLESEQVKKTTKQLGELQSSPFMTLQYYGEYFTPP